MDNALGMIGFSRLCAARWAFKRRRSAISPYFSGADGANFSTIAWAKPRSVTAAIAQALLPSAPPNSALGKNRSGAPAERRETPIRFT